MKDFCRVSWLEISPEAANSWNAEEQGQITMDEWSNSQTLFRTTYMCKATHIQEFVVQNQ